MNGLKQVPFGLRKSKTFCALPWVNISTDPDGSIRPCCISHDHIKKDDGSLYNLGKDKIEDIINSEHFISIRDKMLNGEKIDGCVSCYRQEENNKQSNRMIYNQIYGDRFKQSRIEPNVKYFDLRFGNLCNLKCRTCNPKNSSQIEKEVTSLKYTNIEKFHFRIDSIVENWYDTEMFERNINLHIDNVNMLYVTGGEPTLVENNIKFLKKLVNEGKSKNIILKINSNMTNINKDFYELLDHFKSVIFFASVDGFKEIQEYLRYPSKWETIDQNIRKLLNLSSVVIRPSPVIQIGNINKIVELFEYFESFNRQANKKLIMIDPIVLEFPEYFSIRYLPKDFKLECYDRIENWVKTRCEFQDSYFKEKLKYIRALCQSDDYDKDRLQKFREFNTILDEHRNHHLRSINFELHELLVKYEDTVFWSR